MMFFGNIAALFLLVALVFFIPVLIEYFQIHLVPRFPTLIFASGCAVMGLITFAIGIILDVIVKKNKQNFMMQLNILSSQRKDETDE